MNMKALVNLLDDIETVVNIVETDKDWIYKAVHSLPFETEQCLVSKEYTVHYENGLPVAVEMNGERHEVDSSD